MASTCTQETASLDAQQIQDAGHIVEAPVEILREIARRYGTPTYAYDIGRIRTQVAKLRTHLPPAVEILYSLKANASLGLCGVLAECGLGADVASAGELAIAQAAGFSPERIFLTGPDRSFAVLEHLRKLSHIVVSVDSVSELRLLQLEGVQNRVIVRLRPDFTSYATCSAGPDSRFGLTWDDMAACRELLPSPPTPLPQGARGVIRKGIKVIGFHVFSGSQILSAEGIIHHFRGGVNLALRAADALGVTPEYIDLGGGLGIPYAPGDREVDLEVIGAELHSLAKQVAPARLVLELGRYPVAQAGWYLTSVLAEQTHRGRKAVVVDGGTHQRGDMCGLGLRHKGFAPVAIRCTPNPVAGDANWIPTDILGCLSLPGDVPAENRLMPPLAPGDVLAFPNAGAYGLAASPWLFHSHPAPAEVAFEGTSIQPLRQRRPPESVLEGQTLLQKAEAADY
jgi:diaminopimelate decarboxylase